MSITKTKEQLLLISDRHELQEVMKRLSDIKSEDIQVNVAFLGEFKSGKTTLVNALLGKKILPMFATPTTAVITEISKGIEDKFYVIRKDTDENELKNEISIGQLADAVTNVDINKKVLVQLRDIAFLDEKLLIIDTPGVSSIEKSHDDITFGYLPMVDVAFIVMNINIGSPTKSLLDFLKQYPKEILSKFYFILNHTDTKNHEDIKKIKNAFYSTLCKVTDTPRIILATAQKALNIRLGTDADGIESTGLTEIERIIKDEIPQFKTEIEDKKIMALYKSEAKKLIALLETKLNSLKWDKNEFDENINNFKSEIEGLERDLRNFNDKFKSIKEDCITRIQTIIRDEYIPTISNNIAHEKPIDTLVDSMLQEINQILEYSIKQIKNTKFTSLNANVSQIMQSLIETQTSMVKEITDLLGNIGTVVLAIFLTPAGSAAGAASKVVPTAAEGVAAGAVTAAEKAARLGSKASSAVGKSGKILKIIGGIGKVVKEMNPIERCKRIVLPFITNPKLRDKMISSISLRLELIFSEIELILNEEIENKYVKPLKEKESLIEDERKKRDDRNRNIDNLRKTIKEDIELLQGLA